MSKTTKPDIKPEAKLVNFFTITPFEGSFKVVKLTVDVVSNTVIEVVNVGVEDVLSVCNSSVSKLIRKELGL